jgi:hypothetical protein
VGVKTTTTTTDDVANTNTIACCCTQDPTNRQIDKFRLRAKKVSETKRKTQKIDATEREIFTTSTSIQFPIKTKNGTTAHRKGKTT